MMVVCSTELLFLDNRKICKIFAKSQLVIFQVVVGGTIVRSGLVLILLGGAKFCKTLTSMSRSP